MIDAFQELRTHYADLTAWVAHLLPQYTIPVLERMMTAQFLRVVVKAEKEQARQMNKSG